MALRQCLVNRAIHAVISVCLFSVIASSSVPNPQDYVNLVVMQSAGLVPAQLPNYPHFPPYAPSFNFSNPGKGFLPLPADQNATLLALSLYDWSLPSFERIYAVKYWLIDSNDVNELTNQLFNYRNGIDDPMTPLFGLQLTKTYESFEAEVQKHLSMIQLFPSENRILRYALSMVPSTPQMPKTLYQGLCPDSLFCKQIGGSVNISGDDCISKYFQAGNEITTTVYWSTTNDVNYANSYFCNRGQLKTYLIHIATKANSASKDISAFVYKGEEFLYPPGVTFSVSSGKEDTTEFNLYLTEK